MTSANYRTIFQAIQKKQLLIFTYDGFPREAYPHVLGHTNGEERALLYQVGGNGRHGLRPGGQWRGLRVAEMAELRAVDGGGFRGGDSHTIPNRWVEDVDIDVNRNAKQRYVWPIEAEPHPKKAVKTKKKSKPAKTPAKKTAASNKNQKSKKPTAKKRKGVKKRRKSKSPA